MHLVHPARTRRTCRWMIAVLGLALIAPRLAAQEKSGEKIYKDLLKSTVWVVFRERRSADTFVVRATGTGALVDKGKLLVLTNSHVVGSSKEALVFFPTVQGGKLVAERSFYIEKQLKAGIHIAGEVVAKNTKADLALIKIDKVPPDAHALRLAAEGPGPAQMVHSVGNPGSSGALWVYTPGTVRQVYHKTWRVGSEGGRSELFDAQVVETQSPTNPGDSGGPLVNERGELVGVTHGGARDASLLSLFIDVSEVKKLLKSQGVKITAPPVAKAPAEKNPAKGETKIETGGVNNFSDDPDKQERQAGSKLKLARILAEDGKAERAKERLKDIIKDFPKTKAAEEAKKLLDKLNQQK